MLIFRPVATVRMLTLLFACFAGGQAFADITFTMSGASPYCSGSVATLNYTVSSVTINSGNTYTAQLSDAAGTFGSPVVIGILNSTATSGTISITFPIGTATSNLYKIRILSSNSSFTGSPGSAFTVIQVAAASITITADPATAVGTGSVVYFSSSVTNGGSTPTYQWKRNGSNVGNNSDAYVLTDAAVGDQIQAVVTPLCANPASASSNVVTVSVDDKMTKTNHSWEARATQPDGSGGFINRSNASGFTIGTGSPANRIYVACGSSTITTYHKDLWMYDPTTDAWTQQADLPGSGRYNAVGFSVATKGYIGMGMTSIGAMKDFYQYDPTLNQWLTRASLPAGASAREQAFGFGISGTINKGYVGGGVSSGVDVKDFYEFDPVGNTWSAVAAKPDFAGGKRIGAASFTIGEKGYVVGGYSPSSDTYFKDLYEYDAAGSTWTARASMPGNGRTRATAFSLAGNGYVGMGYSASGYEGKFFQYDPVANTWTQKPYYPGPTTKTFGVGLSLGNRAWVYKDGMMYEYNLLTLASFPSKLCSTETINIDYDASGFVFNANNAFQVQMSPQIGFSVITNLASKISSTPTGTITVQIPTSASGTYYVRMQSNNPTMTTLLETITITRIETNHVVTPTGGTTVCVGLPVTFNSNLTGTGFQWYKNDVVVGTDATQYTAATLSSGDVVKAVRTYTTGCKDPVGITSNLVTMNVRTPAKPIVSLVQPNTLSSSTATAYQWYKNNDAISKATSQTYQMTEAATYKVKITDTQGCSTFSDDLVNVYTGLEDDSYNLDVLTYPSPFSESMFLSVADHIVSQGCDFTLMNELGQTVMNKQRAQSMNKLDLSGRGPGLYFLKVSFGHTTVVRKLVKVN